MTAENCFLPPLFLDIYDFFVDYFHNGVAIVLLRFMYYFTFIIVSWHTVPASAIVDFLINLE